MLVKNQTFHDLVFKDMNNRNEHDCQDLAPQVLECFYFCNSMFPNRDHDCNIQDFAFQVLKFFGVNNFNTKRLLRISFMIQDFVFQDWICFRALAATTVLYIYIYTYVSKPKCWNISFFATPCFQVLTMIALFKTWLLKSWILFGIINFHIRPN